MLLLHAPAGVVFAYLPAVCASVADTQPCPLLWIQSLCPCPASTIMQLVAPTRNSAAALHLCALSTRCATHNTVGLDIYLDFWVLHDEVCAVQGPQAQPAGLVMVSSLQEYTSSCCQVHQSYVMCNTSTFLHCLHLSIHTRSTPWLSMFKAIQVQSPAETKPGVTDALCTSTLQFLVCLCSGAHREPSRSGPQSHT